MISGSKPRGYTVVEIMIFLTVSSVLAVSAMLLINGKQRRTEFSQSVRDLDSKIQDIINDVATGYYPSANNVTCVSSPIGSGVTLTDVAITQGTNSGCTFIGRIVQFAPNGTERNGIRIYSVAGQRLKTPALDAESVLEAKGKVIAQGTTPDTTPDLFEDAGFGGSMRIERVRFTYSPGGPPSTLDTSGIGFFTTFNKYTGTFLNSGSTNTNLMPFAPDTSPPPAFTLDMDSKQFVDYANTKLASSTAPNLEETANPSGGVEICILSQVTEQYALLQIGGSGRQLSTKLTIFNGVVCP